MQAPTARGNLARSAPEKLASLGGIGQFRQGARSRRRRCRKREFVPRASDERGRNIARAAMPASQLLCLVCVWHECVCVCVCARAVASFIVWGYACVRRRVHHGFGLCVCRRVFYSFELGVCVRHGASPAKRLCLRDLVSETLSHHHYVRTLMTMPWLSPRTTTM